MDIVSFTAYSAEELAEKIRDLKLRLTPTLVFAFSSSFFDIGDSHKTLLEAECPVFGATTAGEILQGTNSRPAGEQSIVCCCLDLDPSAFSVRLFRRGNYVS